MKTLKFLLIVFALAGLGANETAWADRGHFAGPPGGHFHHHHHDGRIFLAAPVFYPWWYDWPAPSPPPRIYIEQGYATGYWYYCVDPAGFYPSVTNCPASWVQVEPTP